MTNGYYFRILKIKFLECSPLITLRVTWNASFGLQASGARVITGSGKSPFETSERASGARSSDKMAGDQAAAARILFSETSTAVHKPQA